MTQSGGSWALNILFGIRNLCFLNACRPTCWLGLALRHHLVLPYLIPDWSYERKSLKCPEIMTAVPMDPHPLALVSE
jgi:hypothetical protein